MRSCTKSLFPPRMLQYPENYGPWNEGRTLFGLCLCLNNPDDGLTRKEKPLAPSTHHMITLGACFEEYEAWKQLNESNKHAIFFRSIHLSQNESEAGSMEMQLRRQRRGKHVSIH